MSVQEIKQELTELKTNIGEVGAKVDQVLEKLADTTGGATAAEIEEITAMVTGVRNDVQGVEDKIDAVTPAPSPTPEPTPEEESA